MNDKPLIASVVVLAAAALGAQGIEVSDAERQALVDAATQAVAGLAATFAIIRVWILRARRGSASEDRS